MQKGAPRWDEIRWDAVESNKVQKDGIRLYEV